MINKQWEDRTTDTYKMDSKKFRIFRDELLEEVLVQAFGEIGKRDTTHKITDAGKTALENSSALKVAAMSSLSALKKMKE